MKRALIYKTSKGYFIHSSSETDIGIGIATAPFFKLDNDITIKNLVDHIFLALESSKQNVTMPKNFPEFNRQFLNSLGLKSNSELERKNVKHCSIDSDDINIVFTPSKHAEAPDRGHLYKSKEESVTVPYNANAVEIGNALADAFSKCE
jgi:hypothetical protein